MDINPEPKFKEIVVRHDGVKSVFTGDDVKARVSGGILSISDNGKVFAEFARWENYVASFENNK